MKKGRSRKSYASLKRLLDKTFSEWIRRKDVFSHGQEMCVSCGMVGHWKTMQCGHFIPRHYLAGRWNELNCFVQCPGCNVFKRGNYPGFSSFLNRTYGPERIEELLSLKSEVVKLRASDLQELITLYKSKLEAL